MENRLGADFSDVRIHNDAAARASAAEVGARAYTSGSHVVIGDGGSDKHTLAHELTHVIQQRQGPVAGTDNGTGLKVSDPSDRFEREAEANARRVMSSAPVQRAGGRQDASPGFAQDVAASMVQRAMRIGPPGQAQPETAQQLRANPQISPFIDRHPWLGALIDQVAASPVEYNFQDPRHVVLWVAGREVADHLVGLEAGAVGNARGGTADPDRFETAKRILTQEQQAYATAGESDGGGTYTLFGQSYTLTRQGQGHYYATKVGRNEPVLYQEQLSSEALRAIIDAVDQGRRNGGRPTGVTEQQVDEFVCACLAEPSRWQGEHAFNIFADHDQPPQRLTGQAKGALPMTTGSTWEPALVQLGRETPTRAVAFLNTVPSLRGAIQKSLKRSTASREVFLQSVREHLFG